MGNDNSTNKHDESSKSYNEQVFTEGKDDNFVYTPNEHPKLKVITTVESLFNFTTLFLFIGFLAIYYILYYTLGSVFNSKFTDDVLKSHTINLTIVLLLLCGFLYFYFTLSPFYQSNFFTYLMALFKDEMNDPNTVVIMTVFLLLFYLFVFVMKFPMGKDTKPFMLEIIEFKSIVYLVMLIFIVIIIYGFHFEIVDWIYYVMFEAYKKSTSVFNNKSPSKSTSISTSPSPSVKISPSVKTSPSTKTSTDSHSEKDEVFNVGNNLYTYDDAQSICTAYGARLATYDDIEKSYEAGGEWCNYGWSEGQMIFFPTQKDTWKKLQKDPNKKNNCGRPGINGGYMANPYIKFGVNCYGKKPKPKDSDKLMMMNKNTIDSTTNNPTKIDPNVEKWKSLLSTLTINSYNNNEWSEFDSIPQFDTAKTIYMNTPSSNYINSIFFK
jgi:hypothetical protein